MTMGYCRRFHTGDIPSTQTPGGKGVASIIVLLYLSGALPPRGGHVVTQCLYMSLHDLRQASFILPPTASMVQMQVKI